MRTLQDFTAALEMLVGQATQQLSPAQLDAIGAICDALGGMARGAAALRRAGLGMGFATSPVAIPGSPQPVSGVGGGTAHPDPAPAPAPIRLDPQYRPPPADVDCEEAHRQRNEADRIAGLRADPLVWIEQVGYYVLQIGGIANQIPENDPLRGRKIDELMLSIECLPGTRPLETADADVLQLASAWQVVYDDMKRLTERGLLDADDEQQILIKLGDRPGGALREPDYSNEGIRPAPEPGLVTITQAAPAPRADTPAPASTPDAAPIPQVKPMPGQGELKLGKESIPRPTDQGTVPPAKAAPAPSVTVSPGAVLIAAGQTMTVPIKGVPRELHNESKEPIAITQPMMDNPELIPDVVICLGEPPAPAAAEHTSAEASS